MNLYKAKFRTSYAPFTVWTCAGEDEIAPRGKIRMFFDALLNTDPGHSFSDHYDANNYACTLLSRGGWKFSATSGMWHLGDCAADFLIEKKEI